MILATGAKQLFFLDSSAWLLGKIFKKTKEHTDTFEK